MMTHRKSGRPVAAIAADLNVTVEKFVECFKNVAPAPAGTKPTKERERRNRSVLLPCLQKVNPSITNELLDEVMDRYRR